MALKKCKECGSEVSSKAKKCPSCGVGSPGMSNKSRMLAIFTIVVSLLVVTLTLSSLITLPEEDLYAGSTAFLQQAPELGTLIDVENTSDWANGKRQWIVTDKGEFLFYLQGDEVVTVYQQNASGREEIWRKKGS